MRRALGRLLLNNRITQLSYSIVGLWKAAVIQVGGNLIASRVNLFGSNLLLDRGSYRDER